MASAFPGAIDSFGADVIDGTTDVMADHINFPRSAIVNIETTVRNQLVAKNTSGSTAAVNDLGYLSEAGEYKTTAVAGEVRLTWAVVIAGAANNADIVVQYLGRVTVKYSGSAPAQGSFLTASTAAGSALAQAYMSAGVFGVALAAGSGGTVSALLMDFGQKPAVAENLLADTLTHEASWLAGTTFNDLADDNYGPSLWNILNEANAPDVSGTAGGTNDPFTRYLTITLDGTTQVGVVQFLSAERTKALRGKTVSLSADLWGTGIAAARMAVLIWTGTADAVTSDVVGTWGAGNPTLATNWNYIGTPAGITISSTRTRYSINNLLIPDTTANINNVAVFIWTPSQEASTDVLNVARVKLEPGAVATDFTGRGQAAELREINNFVQLVDASSNSTNIGLGARTATTTLVVSFKLDYPMRAAPALSHNITGYTAGAPGTTTVGAVSFPAAAFFTITGALTVTLAAANKSFASIQLAAGTSWSGTTGDLATLRIGPGVVMLLDSRL